MKFQRQAKILELIEAYDLDTQEDLSVLLGQSGFLTTQATISRDIKELGILKVLTPDGKYKYTVPKNGSHTGFQTRLRNIFHESVTKIEAAKNIVVVKTMPGLASAAAAAIDMLAVNDLVGSIAGDDTVIAVLRTDEAARTFAENASNLLK